MTEQSRGLTGEQISALEMPAHARPAALLDSLIRARHATATPGIVEAGGRMLRVVRLAITEKGGQ
jgi:hypothetical protein